MPGFIKTLLHYFLVRPNFGNNFLKRFIHYFIEFRFIHDFIVLRFLKISLCGFLEFLDFARVSLVSKVFSSAWVSRFCLGFSSCLDFAQVSLVFLSCLEFYRVFECELASSTSEE